MTYGVTTQKGSIYCTDGNYYRPMFVGPGGRCARTWRTKEGAEKFAVRINGIVVSIHSDHGKTQKRG